MDLDPEGLAQVEQLLSVLSQLITKAFPALMVIGTGFPDFVCIKNIDGKKFDVWGVEVKKNGYLDQVEKGMCHWLLENKIFSKILIAKAVQEGRKINVEYDDFEKKYIREEKKKRKKRK